MKNEEYVRRIGVLYDQIMKLRKDDDYVVNQSQMEKFVDVYDFFQDMGEKCDGDIEKPNLAPKECHGGVTARFFVFDVWGVDIPRFSQIINHLSALSIDAEEDGRICISVTVPDVFIKKNS